MRAVRCCCGAWPGRYARTLAIPSHTGPTAAVGHCNDASNFVPRRIVNGTRVPDTSLSGHFSAAWSALVFYPLAAGHFGER
jgi:hypothetical protein